MCVCFVNHSYIEITPDNCTNVANKSEILHTVIQSMNAVQHCQGLWYLITISQSSDKQCNNIYENDSIYVAHRKHAPK